MGQVAGPDGGLALAEADVDVDRDLGLLQELGFSHLRADVGLGWSTDRPQGHLPGVFGDVVTPDRLNLSVPIALSELLRAHGTCWQVHTRCDVAKLAAQFIAAF